jgi:hypothetical protein
MAGFWKKHQGASVAQVHREDAREDPARRDEKKDIRGPVNGK